MGNSIIIIVIFIFNLRICRSSPTLRNASIVHIAHLNLCRSCCPPGLVVYHLWSLVTDIQTHHRGVAQRTDVSHVEEHFSAPLGGAGHRPELLCSLPVLGHGLSLQVRDT